MKPLHEKELARESGYSQQALWYLRTGQRVGKYSYPPVLERGAHWDKIGSTVVYTEAGRAVVMERAAKRGKGKSAEEFADAVCKTIASGGCPICGDMGPCSYCGRVTKKLKGGEA